MSNDTQRASAALRNIIVGFLASDTSDPADTLEGINTTLYPDGALAYVSAHKTTWRLDKTSAVNTVSPALVATPNAGPGRWFLQPGAVVDPRAAQISGTAALTVHGAFAVGNNIWDAIPSASNLYAAALVSSGFSLDTSTGILTYNGPSGQLFEVYAQIAISSANPADVLSLGLSVDGALLGSATFLASAGVATVDTTTPNLPVQISTSSLLTFANLGTLQAIIRNTIRANNVNVTNYTLVVTPVG